MTLETFVRYWKAVETDPAQRGIFLLHNGMTAEDIKTILAGKQKILPLLGQARKEFGAEYWSGGDDFNEFKTYITGMSGKNADGTVRREPYPYAVKNVIIRSTQLADMSHIVLYDVPGFDSPTELHKRQTEEMLKEADAIILVTNAGDRPDLTAPQLDMLRKGQDLDGVKLSEKSFVFGNKIDRASNFKTARDNLAVLKNDAVNKYQITLGNHIVGGSARAYLEKIGLIAEKVASKILDEWQTPDGVKVLLDKMQDYYDNDRFEVLKRRAENTLSKTRTVLQNLLERYSSGELNYQDVSTEILMDIQARLPQFTKEANRITQIHTAKIFNERPFTNALKDDVDNIYPLVAEAHLPLIESEEYELAIDPDGVYPTSKVDGNVRDKLGVLFVEYIVTSTTKFTSERQSELRQALIDSFLQIMGMEATTNYKAELNDSVNKLFDEMLVKGDAECNFNSLVERFVMTLIQTLITQPFAVDERVNKVKEALDELVSLSVYYNMPADKAEKNSLQLESLVSGGDKFFAKILAHEGFDAEVEVDATENENFLRELFEENRDQICKGASLVVELLPFGKWAKLLMKGGINLAAIDADRSIKRRDKLDNKLEDLFYAQNWSRLLEEQKTQSIENAINAYTNAGGSQAKTNESDSLMAQLDEIQERAKNSKRMNSKDDMIATLDADILILRDITAKAVINAIGLERAFNSVITKNVNLINRHLQEREGNAAYRAWIRNNAAKLMPSHFEQIIEQGAVRENKKAIVNAVRNLLNKWD
ncbi:MAG: dynamin family protein, partial [Selenomonadaceae bacterium]|nr:dynamin family protein [Selenomonadaceae bacterium]